MAFELGERLHAPCTVSVADLKIEVIPKRMKNMYLRIDPTGGSIRVTCPLGTDLAAVRSFVKARYAWVKEKQQEVLASPSAQAAAASKQEQARWRAWVSARAPELIEKWEPRLGVKAKALVYRNMKTRWGTCQPKTGKICLNTRLALYPPECLEYVVVHELCHLRVSGHGPAFKALMDELLPEWRRIRAHLH